MPGPVLRARAVGIDTFQEHVAYLHRACPVYRAEGFEALNKVEIRSGGRRILAVLNMVDSDSLIEPGELGLSSEAFRRLRARDGDAVEIAHAEAPASMPALRRKIRGERLDRADFEALVRDIAGYRYSKLELAAFVVATSQFELDRDEIVDLTEAMTAAGRRLEWHERPVVDKHCIGGIPGNRTSMLVVPIVAAHGMLMPKTSSRAITSPAGTADTMAVLAEVDLSIGRMSEIVRGLRGCLAWGGHAGLSPADDVLISVERPLQLDSPPQMVASILSKKLAAGSTHLVLDIPVGPSAKVRSMAEAQRLRRLFEYVASRLNLVLDVVVSDGRQPIGRGIGPVLEARDVMQVLDGNPRAPADLRNKALRLAGRVLEFDPDVRGGDGFALARDILDSGRALAKMNEIIEAQGRRVPPAPASLVHEVLASSDGVVCRLHNLRLATIARLAGAPKIPVAGVDLFCRLGDRVAKGQPLYRIHASIAADLAFARRMAIQDPGIGLGRPEDVPKAYVEG
ncbi:MAG: thymidine phosphorylase family protein [Burkholderiaceae bacterium]|nr:thymidine phosphorylase family protein [Burkholderiaceae bacterium]